jgi:type VI secretion system protein ImpA
VLSSLWHPMAEPRLKVPLLLESISAESPAGEDLRFSLDWTKLDDAKRADDDLNKGAWEAKEPKTADWGLVCRLAQDMLVKKTKDLRVAVMLLEALTRLDGFVGTSLGLELLEKLVESFWDRGLYPLPEGDNLEDRAAAFDWINTKLPDLLCSINITARQDGGADYTYARYLDARAVGRERDYEEGRVSSEKRERFLSAKAEGRCLDLYDIAVNASPLGPVENRLAEAAAVLGNLARLGRLLNGKFGSPEATPGFSEVRNILDEIHSQLDTIVRAKRPHGSADLAAVQTSGEVSGTGMPLRASFLPGELFFGGEMGSANGETWAWAEAESMVRSGRVEQGLAEMARLAQQETSGRARFQRKLLLSDVCLQINRDRLARTVLEELAEQIDAHKLHEWESTSVIGAVWTRLYRIYKRSDDPDRATQLYNRLCRLDPWQALSCAEE